MRNSIIFYKSSSDNRLQYHGYDCCESLGAHLESYGCKVMYVAIPKMYMDQFFFYQNNLQKYLDLIYDVLNVRFDVDETQTKESLPGYFGSDKNIEDHVIIKGTGCHVHGNKHFNAAYNILRYLWYQNYTPMAIIATNLYKIGKISPMDALAIACSFQVKGDRALLPAETSSLNGILFFREKESVIPDLRKGTLFNKAFYRYPIYFDPVITVKGSFFEDAVSTVEAKTELMKLTGIDDINDLPPYAAKSFDGIFQEYLTMKETYKEITDALWKEGLSMNFNDSLLLSRDMKLKKIAFSSAIGSSAYRYVGIVDGKSYVGATPPKPKTPATGELEFEQVK